MEQIAIDNEIRAERTWLGELEGFHFSPTFPRPNAFSLLFVHGAWSRDKIWKQSGVDVAIAGFNAYAMSLRGHGDSKPVADLGKVSTEDYIADIEEAAYSIRGPLVIIGHSMGSHLGAVAAHRNPGKVVGFIGAASAGGRWNFIGWKPAAAMMKRDYLDAMLGEKPFMIGRDDARKLAFNGISEDGFEKTFSELQMESGLAMREIAFGKRALPRLSCPSLIIAPEDDLLTPNQASISRSLGAELESIPGCHMVMLDRGHEMLARKIDSWLTRKFDL